MMSGCATMGVEGPRFTQLDSLPQQDEAIIYFYRPGEEVWNIKGRKFHIFFNGEETGILPYGGYFSRVVRPGKTVITSDSSGLPIPLLPYLVAEATKTPGRIAVDIKPGEMLFIKLRATDEFWNIAGNISIEEKETAVLEMQNTNLVD